MRTHSVICLIVIAAMCAAFPALADGEEPAAGSGLPVPRFVSLKSDEVNVRSGPGTRYPIQWVYRREGWPVEIVEEFDQWRKIQDMEGTAGWVHKTMLEGKRTALIRGKAAVLLRSDPEEDAHAVLKVAPMVLVKLVECTKAWCRVQADGRKGWLRKSALWGVYPAESIK